MRSERTSGCYPVVGVKATLYDGSYHPVDSSEMAFKMATILDIQKGLWMHPQFFLSQSYP